VSWSLRHRLTTLALATAAMAGAMFIVRYVPVEFLPMGGRAVPVRRRAGLMRPCAVNALTVRRE
jgi:hypothetical protein